MTQYAVAGFVLGAVAVGVALLVFWWVQRKQGEVEFPDDLFPQIGEILGEVVQRAARLGKQVTPEQVRQIADWTYFHFLPVRQLFTIDEWRGLLAMVLLWLTEGPPAAASSAPERVEWREFEALLKQL